MSNPPAGSASRGASPPTEAAAAAAPLRLAPDQVAAEAAVALVRAALTDRSFLTSEDTGVFDAAVDRYRRQGLAGLLEPLLDRAGALCALNPAFGPGFARHRGRIEAGREPESLRGGGHRPLRHGSLLILFDSGLFHTLWEIAQIVCGTLPTTAGAAPTVPLDEAQAVLALHRASHRILGGSRFGTQFALSPQAGRAAALLVDGAHLFVLAHEVAHVLLGHSRTPAGAATESVPAGLVAFTDATELAADVLAFRIVTEDLRAAGSKPTPSEVLFRVAGAWLAFACIDLVEQQSYVILARSHPPARQRWDVVRDFSVAAFGSVMIERVDALWVPYDAMARELDRPAPSMRALVGSYKRLVARRGLCRSTGENESAGPRRPATHRPGRKQAE